MPFGAQPLPDGRVRFSLWAPAAKAVELCLEDDGPPIILPMAAQPEGWFELVAAEASAGARYRYRIDGRHLVPDPASRFQPDDVHGPSEVIDPHARRWRHAGWRGRPWEEAVIYELHVGAFTPGGSFAAARERLPYLRELGVTAIELMPVADFPGRRNWGYDGALLFAPDSRYGRPEELKALVDDAHGLGLMVLLDVVYNHFGPEGNYLGLYAPQFFNHRHHTPWGAAINYDGPDNEWVRQFYVHNALYWLDEYQFDGLRLDAVHAIRDDTRPDILTEIAEHVAERFAGQREVHLVLENDDNAARYLVPARGRAPFCAQWNDDVHHALHVLLTGEREGYYADYAESPARLLGRCLTEGFAYQGERSRHRHGRPRGEPSRRVPCTAFVSFLQNHDQVGNRARGERIAALAPAPRIRAALAILLLAPQPPLLFMGQEWGCRQPFPFFSDFGPEVGSKVTEGRRAEFASFAAFAEPEARQRIPDPQLAATFEAAVLDWSARDGTWLELHRRLLALRRRVIAPRLRGVTGEDAAFELLSPQALRVEWRLAGGARLVLVANLGDEPRPGDARPGAPLLYSTEPPETDMAAGLAPWSASWYLGEPPAA
jgi:1,4-alpha-glucan branching enzyme/maltooligosyltrehalose trehalohydrolase